MSGATTSADIQGPTFPTKAYLRNRGVCRVLEYCGNGYFRVLTKRDERIFIHRDRLSFRK